jgi:hypothetical protein
MSVESLLITAYTRGKVYRRGPLRARRSDGIERRIRDYLRGEKLSFFLMAASFQYSSTSF